MRLVVGLGNPGPQYKSHRHNVGFQALDALWQRASGSEWRERFTGLAARAVVAGEEVLLIKPQTFMNLSGRTVQKALQELRLRPLDALVLHDELELPFGELRAKRGGGHGGHNGLRDITAAVGADFGRLRIGIGRPLQGTVEHHVLSPFRPEEAALLGPVLERAVDLVELALGAGLDEAILRTNPLPRAPRKAP
ncbi:MAG: aminoacyl-tRNA hydrolase [Deltaproteobacteria bacterium]|nr:aminoacyl-tRNA hydrolase [Deltaproteobacteria bacterium]